MKKLLTTLTIFIFPLLAVAQSNPRPTSVPAAPDSAKKIADYSVEDVLGVLYPSSRLPEGHPLKGLRIKKYETLKKEWPGAKQEATAEKLFEIVAKSDNDMEGRALAMLERACALTTKQKVDAFLKVYGKLNDNVEKNRLMDSIYHLFDYAPDIRLINLLKTQLDDASVIKEVELSEEKPKVKIIICVEAKRSLVILLRETLKIKNFKSDDFYISRFTSKRNKVLVCQKLKRWMDANADVIAKKCLQFASNPKREKKRL